MTPQIYAFSQKVKAITGEISQKAGAEKFFAVVDLFYREILCTFAV
jgi:hypothetical protein